jgi:hypothetical protein
LLPQNLVSGGLASGLLGEGHWKNGRIGAAKRDEERGCIGGKKKKLFFLHNFSNVWTHVTKKKKKNLYTLVTWEFLFLFIILKKFSNVQKCCTLLKLVTWNTFARY